MKNKLKILIILIGFLLIFFLCFLSFSNLIRKNLYSFDFIKFSTYLNIKILSKKREKEVSEDISIILKKIEKIADLLDFYKDDSILTYLNKNKAITISLLESEFKKRFSNLVEEDDEFFKISNDIKNHIFYFFKKNIDYMDKTYGYFNPFIGNLTLLYNNFEPNSIPPSKDKLIEEVRKISLSKIILDVDKISIKGDAFLNFGGSLKGFLIDLIFRELKEKNYDNFLINCGGDIRASSDGKKIWKIGINDPFLENRIFAIDEITNKSIVTSGNYERFFYYDGKRYFHILNPFTGVPDSDLASVTIVFGDCLDADILSTAIFAMGKIHAIDFINKNKIEALLIWNENGEKKYYNTIKNLIFEK
ncbi:MAG: FAD:protein FMN transferase [Spirochaetes bacterium]|nr:FAD:protein FMN transferase [Spirochaetota bacterium]